METGMITLQFTYLVFSTQRLILAIE